jgi:hypothetical protein
MDDQVQAKGLWFSLEINGEEYVAFISAQAMLIHFQAKGMSKSQLNECFRNNQERIVAVAKNRFLTHATRPVKLDVNDFSGGH